MEVTCFAQLLIINNFMCTQYTYMQKQGSRMCTAHVELMHCTVEHHNACMQMDNSGGCV